MAIGYWVRSMNWTRSRREHLFDEIVIAKDTVSRQATLSARVFHAEPSANAWPLLAGLADLRAAGITDRRATEERERVAMAGGPAMLGKLSRDRGLVINEHWGNLAMRKLVALSSYALLLGYAAAGLSADIVGTTVDPAGSPIPGVTVSVQNQAGAAIGASVSDETGKYAIHGLPPGIYTLIAKGQTAVAYVGDRGITVDWGIAANSQVIAAARQGTALPSESASGKVSMKDLAAKQVGAGNSDRNNNAVQHGDCAEDEDEGEQTGDAEMATNVHPGAEGQGRRHCRQTESN